MTLQILPALLRALAVLACPLMMFWCLRGMGNRGCQKPDPPAARPPGSGPEGPRDAEAEIQDLKARLARLEAER